MSERKYKLIYFNTAGRAEATRILFHLAGQTFEDVRLDFSEWLELKGGDTAPFGQLPVLEIDGFKLAQSLTILRYVARQFGLGGKTPLEEAEVDSYIDLTSDLVNPWSSVVHIKSDNEAIKEYLVKEALTKSVEILKYFEKRLTDKDYLVGEELTAADVHFMCMLEAVVKRAKEFPSLEDFPAVRAHGVRMRENAKVAEWIRNRPEDKV